MLSSVIQCGHLYFQATRHLSGWLSHQHVVHEIIDNRGNMNGVNRHEIPQLLTRRLLLRGFNLDDAEPLRAILAKPNVLRYFPRTEPWSLTNVEKWLEGHWNHWSDHGFGWWAVTNRQNEQLLGWCGLCLLDETGEVEVKYLLRPSSWGQGVATEAARQSLGYAFGDAGLSLVIGLTHPDNIASQRVLEKIGLTFRNRAVYFNFDCLRFARESTAADL
jgi:ribosomal-protein-alanine N-acetyltransferase